MLDKISHRGPAGRQVIETPRGTVGVVWPELQAETQTYLVQSHMAMDELDGGHFAMASEDFNLKRDPLGVAPLYYGQSVDGALCFASEVKALLEATRQVRELPPGHINDGEKLYLYDTLAKQQPAYDPPEQVVKELRRRLEAAVEKHVGGGEVGVWLSGGLDSSTAAALARPHLERLHTFVAGLSGSPDLEHARVTADYLGCKHHEVIVQFDHLLTILPDVIYHLESFDALLVRSSLMNYLVAKRAADYVPAVFSGERGDELFAGYEYLKSLHPAKLADELVDITNRLHNTALQRVDRCASAHGLLAYVVFLDPGVVEYAFRIPTELKLHDGVEKWILRQAIAGALPEAILNRPKAKFWEGAGVGNLLAQYADRNVSDQDFEREKLLPGGWLLDSKEELLYYRVFREHFRDLVDLSWMGRTKAVPNPS